MVTIRLKPTGRKHRRSYRVVVMEKRSKATGRAIDDLGYYNPLVTPADLHLDHDRLRHWINNGAHISEGVQKLLGNV
ncbi:MAG TPA: 30S ribosomal protein S16 [Patescibacteria group bacterium]|nr:30S ribosomal protein S16 [Patescibacteria group bacterium]